MKQETQDFLRYNPGIRILVHFAGKHIEPGFMQKSLSSLDHSKEMQLVHFQSSAVFNLGLARL